MATELAVSGGRELPTVALTDIPPLPEAALYVLSVARKPNISAGEVAEALGLDQSIALRYLSIANSSYFAPRQRITTLGHCVAWLGLEFVCSTLVTLGMDRIVSMAGSVYLDRLAFWQHNLGTATACEMIAGRLNHEQPGEAHVVGLTHDIGKQVLLLKRRHQYDECLARAAILGEPLYDLEEEMLGLDHAMAGALALREWKFNPELVHVVLNHHEVLYGTVQGRLMATFRLAHHICSAIGYGRSGDPKPQPLEVASLAKLGVDQAFVGEISRDLGNTLAGLDEVILQVSKY